jgi:hypothetical protein
MMHRADGGRADSDWRYSATLDHTVLADAVKEKARTASTRRRCAANIAAPVGQSAVTVPSRRGSDWRPRPIRLLFTRAPSGAQQQLGLGAPVGETSRTRKPRPASARRWGVPARTRAHRECEGAHRERRGAHSERPAAYAAHEDRGHQAAASALNPVPGSCLVLGDCSPLCGCSWVGSSHAPAKLWHLARPTLARPPAPRCLSVRRERGAGPAC